jgi:uncharacterized protein YceH (UPF0502 family)
MDVTFDPVEIRALGCLIEKQITTPEYYPLSLNTLVNACNQTTNRDPVTTYDESTVERALESLRQKGLVWTVTNSRVPKYGNRFGEKFTLGKPEVAAMCVLMLRGSQTAGEIRGRSGRLHEFANLEEVDRVLESLMHTEPPLAMKLPRVPGAKERRFAHLLGGEVSVEGREAQSGAATAMVGARADNEKIAQLEREIEALRQELQELRQQFLDLKKQFE